MKSYSAEGEGENQQTKKEREGKAAKETQPLPLFSTCNSGAVVAPSEMARWKEQVSGCNKPPTGLGRRTHSSRVSFLQKATPDSWRGNGAVKPWKREGLWLLPPAPKQPKRTAKPFFLRPSWKFLMVLLQLVRVFGKLRRRRERRAKGNFSWKDTNTYCKREQAKELAKRRKAQNFASSLCHHQLRVKCSLLLFLLPLFCAT